MSTGRPLPQDAAVIGEAGPVAGAMRSGLLVAVAVLAPLAAVLVYNIGVLGRVPYLAFDDTATGMFSFALNWLGGEPLKLFHHPAYFYSLLAGIAGLATGPEPAAMGLFSWIGLAMQAVVGLIGVGWLVWLNRWLRLPAHQWLIASAIVATMPTMILFADVWSPYSMSMAFALPTLLGCQILATGREAWQPRLVWVTGAGIGFLLANMLLFVPVLVAVCAGLALHRHPAATLDALRAVAGTVPPRAATVLVCAAAVLLGASIVPEHRLAAPAYLPALAGAGLLGGLVAAACLRFDVPRVLLVGAGLPVFLGLLAGCNAGFLYWPESVWLATVHKGGAAGAVEASAGGLFGFVAQSWVWHHFVTAVLCLSVWLAVLAARRAASGEARFLLATNVVAIVLLALMTADVVSADTQIERFGLSSRHWLAAVPLVVMNWVWLARRVAQPVRLLAGAITVALCALSAVEGASAMSEMVATIRTVEEVASARVDRFLAASPENAVVCVRVRWPEPCRALYAYQTYRSPGSLQRIGPDRVRDGRVLAVDGVPADCPAPAVCLPTGDRPAANVMVLYQRFGAARLPPFLVLEWQSPRGLVTVARGVGSGD